MTAYYSENDAFNAAWLEELIREKQIADGVVDTRSIEDVCANDLRGFVQCHFFAGVGVWSYALRRAGWPDNRPVWTGSCPCQPFSAAGKGGGFTDERHLWPHWYWLITQCRPVAILGEQVASKDGLAWFDLVQADLERPDYTTGGIDSCSAGFGAPHIRQRLYWLAYTAREQCDGSRIAGARRWLEYPDGGATRGIRDTFGTRLEGYGGYGDGRDKPGRLAEDTLRPTPTAGAAYGLADFDGGDASAKGVQRGGQHRQQPKNGQLVRLERPGPTNGFWRDADWLLCRDERWRPVGPGTFPLAHGAAARMGRLRGYGNALNAEQATAFVEAALEILDHA